MRRWGERSEFDENQQILPILPQMEFGETIYRIDGKRREIETGFTKLEAICYISVGMVINANERGHLGVFTTDDVLANSRDKTMPTLI